MKSSANLRSVLVLVILTGAIAFTLVAVGCFGGDDEEGTQTTTTAAAGATTTEASETTVVAGFDPLSSFKSKDPFIPQAQATTTVTVATTSSTIPPTTSLVVTTTAPHRLRVTSFPGGGFVAFTLDSGSFTSSEGALLAGLWGSIEVISVQDSSAPFKATFRRNGTYNFTLELGKSVTW